MSTLKFVDHKEDSVSRYYNELRKEESLNKEEELKVIERIKQGDQRAMDKLIKSNLKFVVSVAKSYKNRGLKFADLISEGNYGLMKAARKFDPAKEIKFISYAVWWIRQSIIESINENGRTIRLPVNVINDINKSREFDSVPTCSSYNVHINEDGDELLDILEGDDSHNDIYSNIDNKKVNVEYENLLSILDARERAIIEYYYGINREELTLEAIGEELDLTKERVRQIKEKAIKKLRNSSALLFLLKK